MADRLQTQIDLRDRATGIYQGASEGVRVPVGHTRFVGRVLRPNSLQGEKAWPSRGLGGTSEIRALDRKSGVNVSCLDTEVVRAFFFLSLDDGATWSPCGHMGTLGGDYFDRRGDLVLESRYIGELPEPLNPRRRLFAVLDLAEPLATSIEIDTDAYDWPLVQRFDLHRSIAVESTATGSATSASSVSTSGNVSPAGSDRYLVALGGNAIYGTLANYTSMAYGATGLTQVFTDGPGGLGIRVSAAQLVAPSTTPATCSYTVAASQDYLAVVGVAFSGVDQATPRDAPPAVSSGSGSSPTHTVTAGEAGDVRIAAVVNYTASGTLAIGSGEVSRANFQVGIDPYEITFAVSTKEDNGSDAMNWSGATGSFGWAMRGFNINQATGGGGGAVIPATSMYYARLRR